MNPRLKKIIFSKLNDDLSKVEIILAENQSIWFIDRANKYWYFELEKSGKLWWRYEFFTEFFIIFCLKVDEFQPILSEWVEGILNRGVNTTSTYSNNSREMVEGVLNYGVNTTNRGWQYLSSVVEGVLNYGVNTTTKRPPLLAIPVEGVLNCGVNTTDGALTVSDNMVEGILNREVNTAMPKNNLSIGVEGIFDSNINMTPRSGHRLHTTVEGILNHGYRKGSRKVDEVLNIGVNTTEYCGIIPSCDLEKVLNREINEIDGGELFENDKVEDILNRDTNSTAIVGTVPPLLMEGNLNHKVVSISHASEKIAFTQQVLLNELISKIESATPLDTPAHGSVDEVLKNS